MWSFHESPNKNSAQSSGSTIKLMFKILAASRMGNWEPGEGIQGYISYILEYDIFFNPGFAYLMTITSTHLLVRRNQGTAQDKIALILISWIEFCGWVNVKSQGRISQSAYSIWRHSMCRNPQRFCLTTSSRLPSR